MSNDASSSSRLIAGPDTADDGQLAEYLARISIDGGEAGFTREQAEALPVYCERCPKSGHSTQKLVFRALARLLSDKGSLPSDVDAYLAKRVLNAAVTVLKHLLRTDRSRRSSEEVLEQASLLSAGLGAIHASLLIKDAENRYCITLDQSDLSTAVDLLLSCAHYLPRLPTSQTSGIRTFEPNSLPRRGSAVSLRAESVYSTDDATDCGSDVTPQLSPSTEAQQRKKVSSASRTVRQNAISCLAGLNEVLPAQLFSHWPKMLSRPPPSVLRASAPFHTAPHSEPILSVIWTDPVLSVRLGVCHLLESMFKQARARGFLQIGVVEQQYGGIGSRFTSLSARMGSLIAEIRSFIVDFLEVAAGASPSIRPALRGERSSPPATLVEAMLRATSSLITATRLAKLKKSHADVLRDPILRLTSHSEAAIAIAAYNALSNLTKASNDATNNSQARPTSLAIIGPTVTANTDLVNPGGSSAAISGLLGRLGEDSSDTGVLAEAWHALLAFVQQKSEAVVMHQDWLRQRISEHLTSDDQSLRHACVTFLVHIARETSSSEGAPAQDVLHLLTTAAEDVSPLVRTEVLQALPSLMASEPDNNQIRGLLNNLIKDSEGAVRAAAIRAVGLLLVPAGDIEEGQAANPLPPATVIPYAVRSLGLETDDKSKDTAVALSPLTDTVLLVRLRASWTLGNLCQAIKALPSPSASPSSPHLLRALLTASTKLLFDDERIAVNALRSTGLVLSVVDANWTHIEESAAPWQRVHLEGALRGVLQAVRAAKNPKTKWNGLNALQAALSNGVFSRWLASNSISTSTSCVGTGKGDLHAEVMRLLAEHLAHKTFKVKLAAIGCLLLLVTLPLPSTPPGLETTVSSSDSAPASAGTNCIAATAAADEKEGETLRAAVEGALQRLDAEVAEGNFAEVRVHGESVRCGLEELRERLASRDKR